MKDEIKRAFVDNKTAILVSIANLVISLILGYFYEGYLYSILLFSCSLASVCRCIYHSDKYSYQFRFRGQYCQPSRNYRIYMGSYSLVLWYGGNSRLFNGQELYHNPWNNTCDVRYYVHRYPVLQPCYENGILPYFYYTRTY